MKVPPVPTLSLLTLFRHIADLRFLFDPGKVPAARAAIPARSVLAGDVDEGRWRGYLGGAAPGGMAPGAVAPGGRDPAGHSAGRTILVAKAMSASLGGAAWLARVDMTASTIGARRGGHRIAMSLPVP